MGYETDHKWDGSAAISGTCAAPCSALVEFPCTECGGDAYVGMSSLGESSGRVLIRKGERLCMRCAKRRGGFNPFESNAEHEVQS